MSKEKPDEFLSWRGRLNRPEALPEQGLDDREVSWERLAERLQEKPRRRLAAYWIAAACLLLALAPVAHLFQDRRAPLVLHSPHRPQLRPEKVASASGTAATPGTTPASHAIETPRPVISFHRATRTPASRLAATTLAATTLPALAGLKGHPPSIAGPVIPPTDTANRLIAQRPAPRKPLRIISLNEINKEGLTPAMSTGRSGFFHIGQGIPGRGISPDPASRQDQDKDYLIKINLSSQNR